ncbi:MAG TPA: IS110 family transposase [Candidatus Dormibacteraeota bacterium]|nr:IS110 family transposase [Candidatus Dormibacteraeota bacterium]
MVLMGIDWGEVHHDVCLVDTAGKTLARRRVPDGLVGVTQIHELVAEHAAEGEPVCIGIEVDHGLLVRALVAAGYEVYAINPMAVSRYRDRHAVARTKSDAGDAKLLADLVRTDRHLHRQLRGDSELASAIRILARSHQEAIRSRRRHANQLRTQLREYYPGLLEGFELVEDPEAVELLLAAPTPWLGRRLSRHKIAAVLRRGGRQLRIDERAVVIQECLRRPQLEQPALIAEAFAKTASSLARRLKQLNQEVATLEGQLAELFEMHPDAEIYRSLPGLGIVLGARVLGESGDDPTRYANARARRSYSGNAPRTVASGKSLRVAIRQARNDRLADAYYQAAFVCLTRSVEGNAYYRRLRASGKSHSHALRALANKLAGVLDGCLRRRQTYSAAVAWPSLMEKVA